MRIGTLLPAAGAALRMGAADKLLEPVDGIPVLRHAAEQALAAGLGPVAVTLPPADSPRHAGRRAALAGLGVGLLPVADAAEGMAASLRAGVAALADCAAVLILPTDMPELAACDLRALAAAFAEAADAPILRGAAEDGTPGHPVLLPGWVLPEIAHVRGDSGGREVLAAHRHRLRLVPLPGRRATTDLDTPEAWAAWRAATGR